MQRYTAPGKLFTNSAQATVETPCRERPWRADFKFFFIECGVPKVTCYPDAYKGTNYSRICTIRRVVNLFIWTSKCCLRLRRTKFFQQDERIACARFRSAFQPPRRQGTAREPLINPRFLSRIVGSADERRHRRPWQIFVLNEDVLSRFDAWSRAFRRSRRSPGLSDGKAPPG